MLSLHSVLFADLLLSPIPTVCYNFIVISYSALFSKRIFYYMGLLLTPACTAQVRSFANDSTIIIGTHLNQREIKIKGCGGKRKEKTRSQIHLLIGLSFCERSGPLPWNHTSLFPQCHPLCQMAEAILCWVIQGAKNCKRITS